ncbi:MAG: hypothetical protein JXA96_12815 [Sedimentisphaerales bacterium]|nr:hypothetical protein [Sedimentisphaerales bacterium]
MDENYDFKKLGADKIAFLGMFLVAVIIAQLLVSINSGLKFSEPIELVHAGLSVSIPAGKDWQSSEQWNYRENTFYLLSSLGRNANFPDIGINCKYFLNTQNTTPIVLLKQKIGDINDADIETELIQKENLTISWAQVNRPIRIIEAVAELPGNHIFTIEVLEISLNLDIAESIFKEIINSLSFNEDNIVQTGADFVAEIKRKGIDSLLNNSNMQSCFLRKDSANNNIGFTIDMLGFLNSDEDFTIRGASDLYLSVPDPREQKTMFRCDKGLDNFIWQSRMYMKNSREDVTITLDEPGTITVVNDNSGRSRQYLNCSNVVPNILLESFIEPAIQRNINHMVIDLIDSNGNISPTQFYLKPADNTDEGYTYIVTLKSFKDSDSTERFYLDENNRVTRADGNYILERTDIETIEKEFPGMADYISEQMKLLDSYSI